MENPAIEAVAALRAQLWDAGFRPVPIYTWDHPVEDAGKRPLGNNWSNIARENPPGCLNFPPVPHALNSGILCDGLRAIDIDVDDPEIASRCRSLVVQRFGEAPIRMRRNSPRCLVLYRAATGTPSKVVLAGRLGKIEVLGKGQQFVAFGRHPTGAELEWFPEPPGEESFHNLPPVDEDALLELLGQIAPIIDATPPQRTNGHDHASGDPQADPLRIAAALNAIANNGPADWEAWNRIGMAVWRATGGSEIGWQAFNAWSARNASYDPAETHKRWEHYETSPPTSIGAGTLFHMARSAHEPPAPDLSEPPPDVGEGWWASLEQHLLDGPAEVGDLDTEPPRTSANPDKPPDLENGGIIDPRNWTAPAPLREWIVQDWIPRGYVTGLYGDGGIGKSLLAQQLLTSVASSRQWLGMDVRGGPAFGFMCEDDTDELHRRQEAINRGYQLSMSSLALLRYASRVGFDNLLMTFNERNQGFLTPLFSEMVAFLTKYRPALVVIDTVADTFGGDEIRRAHARQFVQGVGGNIARAFDCAVLFAAHPSAAGISQGTGTGGSTAWSNTFRSRLYLTADKDHKDQRQLSRMKANYAPTNAEMILAWEDGCFVPHGARENVTIEDVTWPVLSAIFEEIMRGWNAGEPWSNRPQTRNQGRYLPLWVFTTYGIEERAAASIIQKWMANGHIKERQFDSRNKLMGLKVMKPLQPPVGGRYGGGSK